MDCIFCKIASGEIPGQIIYQDDTVVAFNDINPAAPVHFLVIPRQHITSCAAVDAENSAVVAHIFEVIAKLAKELDLLDGFRVISNAGALAGQSVDHLHFHVLGKKELSWPPV